MYLVLRFTDYSAAVFYVLCAILCLGNFLHVQALTPKGVLLMKRKPVHDFLLRIIWRWQGNMSQDKDNDCLVKSEQFHPLVDGKKTKVKNII